MQKFLRQIKDNLQATALVVKDGKFVYVGNESGLSDFKGEIIDLGGRFIMPGIIDSHVHVTLGVGYEFADIWERIPCFGKKTILNYMTDYILNNPGLKRYRFFMDKKNLEGEELTKDDLDLICPDNELQIQEGQGHSIWVNSKILDSHNITDDTRDPVPGLSFYVRKNGHVTGEMSEGATALPVILDCTMDKSDVEIDAALQRWIDFSVNAGVSGVFDAGIPGFDTFHERVYKHLRALDMMGKLPIYIDGCYVIASQWQAKKGLEELKRFRRVYNTEHLKVHTFIRSYDENFHGWHSKNSYRCYDHTL